MRRRRVLLLTTCLCAAALLAPAAPALASDVGLARTPPMGWNDWYSAYCGVSAGLVEQTAAAMVADGMKAAGYRYVNIDDCWMAPSRDSAGNLVADPAKFPDGIKPVADYVHGLGLKLGIYEDAGTTTCAFLPGSYGHEAQDAAAFASWGVDFVKYDRCHIPYSDFPGQSQAQVDQTLFARMRHALEATGRPMVFSACDPIPAADPAAWGPKVSNMWRTTPDLQDNFGSMLVNFEGTVGLFRSARPGTWNDPDLLHIGNGGSTMLEYQTEFSLWAEMAAPLIASTSLIALSPAAQAIYENRNVIAVDQDPLGRPGVPVSSERGLWVLSKTLRGGDRSVVLFNSTDTAATISTSAAVAGLPSAPGYRLQNLWTGTVSGTTGAIGAFVPAHGVAMFTVSPVPRPRLLALSPHTVLSVDAVSSQLAIGHSTVVRESFANEGPSAIKRLALSLRGAAGWRIRRLGSARVAQLSPGQRFTVAFRVTAPGAGPATSVSVFRGGASYDPPGPAKPKAPPPPLRSSAVAFGETLLVPVGAPFATADVTGHAASFTSADGVLAITSRGTGVFPSYEGAPPTDSYAAIYLRGAAAAISTAQVTVTSDPAGGTAGAAGLIERNAVTAPRGQVEGVVLYVSSNGAVEMAWNAFGGRDVDSWVRVPNVFVFPPVTLRLARSGNTYAGYYSTNGGATWALVDTVTVAPGAAGAVQDVGFFHASGLRTWTTTATFIDPFVS